MEVKQEITNIIDTLPSEALDDLLVYLKRIQKVPKKKMNLSFNLRTILKEDKQLLKKLAK